MNKPGQVLPQSHTELAEVTVAGSSTAAGTGEVPEAQAEAAMLPSAPLAQDVPILIETRSAQESDEDRRKAKQWLEMPLRSAFNHLIVLRSTMQPLVDLLYDQFKIGGEEHELPQRSELAAAFLSQPPGPRPSRQYVLTFLKSAGSGFLLQVGAALWAARGLGVDIGGLGDCRDEQPHLQAPLQTGCLGRGADRHRPPKTPHCFVSRP